MFNVTWDFYRRAFCDRSTLLSFFLFLTLFKGENSFNLFINIAVTPAVLEWGNWENTDWAGERECSFPKHGMKNCIPQKTFQQSTNSVSSFLPQNHGTSFTYFGVCMHSFLGFKYPDGRPVNEAFNYSKNESIRVTKNMLISALWAVHRNWIVYSILNWSIHSRRAVGWIFIRILVNGFQDGFCANFSRIMNDGPS